MRGTTLLLAGVLLATFTQTQAKQSTVLVILEKQQLKSTHSIFFGHLRQLGYHLDFRSADDKKLQLRDWDDWLYDKVICFAAAVPGTDPPLDLRSLFCLCAVSKHEQQAHLNPHLLCDKASLLLKDQRTALAHGTACTMILLRYDGAKA